MSSEKERDVVSTLHKNSTCLRILTDDSRTKPELVDTLGCSRSTVDRKIRTLSENDLVEYADGNWKPTILGRLASQRRRSYLSAISDLANSASILSELDTDNPIDWRFLDGIDAYEADTAVPDGVVETLFDPTDKVTHIRGFAPRVLSGQMKLIYRNMSDASFEFVLPTDVIDRLEDIHSEYMSGILASESVEVHRQTVPFSFGLWISDDERAGIVVYTGRGIRGVLVNDTDEALSWADELYARTKEGTTTVRTPTTS